MLPLCIDLTMELPNSINTLVNMMSSPQVTKVCVLSTHIRPKWLLSVAKSFKMEKLSTSTSMTTGDRMLREATDFPGVRFLDSLGHEDVLQDKTNFRSSTTTTKDWLSLVLTSRTVILFVFSTTTEEMLSQARSCYEPNSSSRI